MKHDISLGIELVAVGEESRLKAQKRITGCGACSGFASRPLQSVLGDLLGNGGATEYFLCFPLDCPRCACPILESTLVSIGEQPTQGDMPSVEVRPEKTEVIFVDELTLLETQQFISGCEHCASDSAEITFDYLLDVVTGSDPTITEYLICHPATCPRCHHEVMEKTLVVSD